MSAARGETAGGGLLWVVFIGVATDSMGFRSFCENSNHGDAQRADRLRAFGCGF